MRYTAGSQKIVKTPTPFLIIDLVSQAYAVQQHVRGWRTADILEWLGRQGELTRHQEDFYGKEVYRFENPTGFSCGFYLDGDQFTFFGDNTLWRPKP